MLWGPGNFILTSKDGIHVFQCGWSQGALKFQGESLEEIQVSNCITKYTIKYVEVPNIFNPRPNRGHRALNLLVCLPDSTWNDFQR